MYKMQPQQNFMFVDFRVKPPSCYHPGNELLITILLTRLQLQGADPEVYFHFTKQERQSSPKPGQRYRGKAYCKTVQELEGDTQHLGSILQPGSTSGHTRTSPEQCTGSSFSKEVTAGRQNLNMDQQPQRWQG